MRIIANLELKDFFFAGAPLYLERKQRHKLLHAESQQKEVVIIYTLRKIGG